jgi:hypothetical protein
VPRVGAALATPFSRFERLTILKTPGFAGGWLFRQQSAWIMGILMNFGLTFIP